MANSFFTYARSMWMIEATRNLKKNYNTIYVWAQLEIAEIDLLCLIWIEIRKVPILTLCICQS